MTYQRLLDGFKSIPVISIAEYVRIVREHDLYQLNNYHAYSIFRGKKDTLTLNDIIKYNASNNKLNQLSTSESPDMVESFCENNPIDPRCDCYYITKRAMEEYTKSQEKYYETVDKVTEENAERERQYLNDVAVYKKKLENARTELGKKFTRYEQWDHVCCGFAYPSIFSGEISNFTSQPCKDTVTNKNKEWKSTDSDGYWRGCTINSEYKAAYKKSILESIELTKPEPLVFKPVPPPSIDVITPTCCTNYIDAGYGGNFEDVNQSCIQSVQVSVSTQIAEDGRKQPDVLVEIEKNDLTPQIKGENNYLTPQTKGTATESEDQQPPKPKHKNNTIVYIIIALASLVVFLLILMSIIYFINKA